jgi:hypothetical protein
MLEAAPRFEQVPIEVARKVAQQEKSKMNRLGKSVCAICGNEVKLEHCKIDEDGEPVHSECYVNKVLVIAGNRLNTSHHTL